MVATRKNNRRSKRKTRNMRGGAAPNINTPGESQAFKGSELIFNLKEVLSETLEFLDTRLTTLENSPYLQTKKSTMRGGNNTQRPSQVGKILENKLLNIERRVYAIEKDVYGVGKSEKEDIPQEIKKTKDDVSLALHEILDDFNDRIGALEDYVLGNNAHRAASNAELNRLMEQGHL